MGAVMEITTRMPTKREGSIEQSGALQSFDLYGTAKSFGTSQTAATFGDRFGKFSFWASGNYQKSNSQPLTYVTATAFPTGTTGGYTALNKLGAAANVLGASGLLQTGMLNAKLKTTYDLTPTLRASYSYGMWQNDASAGLDSYIAKGTDATFAAQGGFASGTYELFQRHSAHALSLRSNTNGTFDFDLSATSYRFDFDKQRTPTTAPANGTSFTGAGRVAALDGSGWQTFDAKGIWRPDGVEGTHTVTFGAHHEQYRLFNPTYNVADWRAAQPYTGVATEGDGKTRTQALWAQDRWRLSPSLVFTVGGRYETYRAFDGYNVNGNTKITQPTLEQTKFSPKGVLAWTPNADWTLSASVAKAYRFATAAELYQLVSTGVTFTSPNPTLKPDDVLATELRVERTFERAKVQVALFQDEVHDAIISQFLPLVAGSNTLFSYISNVDHVRARGVELVVSEHDMLVKGLEFGGSVTYLDARTVSTAGRPSATAAVGSANGKKLPNIPDWRASFTATYRPTARLAITGAGRYSDKLWTTLDNADVNTNTYQGFSSWFVADAKVSYAIDQHWSAALGVDNVLNRKYFLFHPFPQRTWVGSVRFGF
jgi:iron complex outermembrane receptor protein